MRRMCLQLIIIDHNKPYDTPFVNCFLSVNHYLVTKIYILMQPSSIGFNNLQNASTTSISHIDFNIQL